MVCIKLHKTKSPRLLSGSITSQPLAISESFAGKPLALADLARSRLAGLHVFLVIVIEPKALVE